LKICLHIEVLLGVGSSLGHIWRERKKGLVLSLRTYCLKLIKVWGSRLQIFCIISASFFLESETWIPEEGKQFNKVFPIWDSFVSRIFWSLEGKSFEYALRFLRPWAFPESLNPRKRSDNFCVKKCTKIFFKTLLEEIQSKSLRRSNFMQEFEKRSVSFYAVQEALRELNFYFFVSIWFS